MIGFRTRLWAMTRRAYEKEMRFCRKYVLLIFISLFGIVVLTMLFRSSEPQSSKIGSKEPNAVDYLVITDLFEVVQDVAVIPYAPAVIPDVPAVIPDAPQWNPDIPRVSSVIPPSLLVKSVPKIACRQPDLDINDPAIAKFFLPTPAIECNYRDDWVCIDKGVARLCNDVLVNNPDTTCNFTFLKRVSDFSTVENLVVQGEKLPLPLKSDFFKVNCSNKQQPLWSNVMAGIAPNPSALAEASWDKLPGKALGLNILMWGFDSLSRNTFIRKLPNTYSYLTEQLGAIVLKGYNIVGDGTPQALIPILTGQTELELPDTRKRIPGSKFVNVYPFVWKEYKKHGYVTAFAEDSPHIAAFTYRLRGFDEQPTTHYMRPFYLGGGKDLYKSQCVGGIPRHKVMMNWVRHFYEMYKEKPKFLFSFHNELSHDNYNKVGAADNDLLDMIRNLDDDGYLNNTLLIVMSDHGHRFAAIRELQQGKQEERLPFFSFTFPPWVEKKYPKAIANFRTNINRLATPFDIYPTLRDVLDFKSDDIGDTSKRSISLFTEVPPTRTCQMAHIEPHWCTCLDWKQLSTNDTEVIGAANALVNFFNSLTLPQSDLCERLSLETIVWAGWLLPTDDLLKFKHNADMDGFVPELTGNAKPNVKLYQVQIHTTPGDGHFEATLNFDIQSNTYNVKESDISRINKYGRAADCMAAKEGQLRKYCYCKTR